MLTLVIRGASIVDGSGAPAFAGDVGIDGERIAVVDRVPGRLAAEGAQVLDGTGLVLAPGLIDVHTHADLAPLVLPTMESTIRQGVTTVVTGNCGTSPWPLAGWEEGLELAYADPAAHVAPTWRSFGDYLAAIDAARPAANVAGLVGQGAIRQEVLGLEDGVPPRRPASVAERARMRAMARDAVREGAVGISTGLIYVPGLHAATDEIAEVARGAAEAGGIYASHIRGESVRLFDAVDEAIAIGRAADLPVHVSHLKCESAHAWGRTGELLDRVFGSGATGDQYPYTAWNTVLSTFLPSWAPIQELDRLAASATDRDRLRTAVEHGEEDFVSSVDGIGWDRIVIEEAADARHRGRSVAAIAEAEAVPPFEAFLELLLAGPGTTCIGHGMLEDDVRAILADERVFVASDGSSISPVGPAGSVAVHPRNYGTFPRALALCRDERLLPLERVIRKMTSLPADRFNLRDRGRIAEGAFADLVLLDADRIRDLADFEHPHRFAEGVAAVIVNGTIAWRAGSDAITRAGRALRRG